MTAVKEGTILLFSCVTYQKMDGGIFSHTGTTAEIAPVSGSIQFMNGVDIPGTRVKIQRPSFGWENYADWNREYRARYGPDHLAAPFGA